ncbi:ankyrin repeat domain-containing protein [Parashewanella tropica]|uniref:ankyrin repeat domain-containing protein n=1 Tax=Parashewanella tropica TaxID=2547970 RepID=UPI0010595BBE|nr:ankyrin repeat domain-containing protein [Parashewanella tropica]
MAMTASESTQAAKQWTLQAVDYGSVVVLQNPVDNDRYLTEQFTQIGQLKDCPHSATVNCSDGKSWTFSFHWCATSKQWLEFHQGQSASPDQTPHDCMAYTVLHILNGRYDINLFLAATKGDTTETRRLLGLGFNLCVTSTHPLSEIKALDTKQQGTEHLPEGTELSSAESKRGQTALHIAVICDQLNVVEELLESGSPINTVNDAGNTPLHEAAINGSESIFELLLHKAEQTGVQIDAVNASGNTLLHEAVIHGRERVFVLLLQDAQKAGSESSLLKAKNASGYTPFHLSVLNQRTNIGKIIISTNHYDLKLEDESDSTLLGYALVQKSTDYLDFLIEEAQKSMEPAAYTLWLMTSLKQLIKSDCDEKIRMLGAVLGNEAVNIGKDNVNLLFTLAVEESEFGAAMLLLKLWPQKNQDIPQDEQKIEFLIEETQKSMEPAAYTLWLMTLLKQLIKNDCDEKRRILDEVLGNKTVNINKDDLKLLFTLAIDESEFDAAMSLLKLWAQKSQDVPQEEQEKQFSEFLKKLEPHLSSDNLAQRLQAGELHSEILEQLKQYNPVE